MNNRYVIANWKMNLSLSESVQLAKKINIKLMKKIWQRQVVICPDFLSLFSISSALEKSKLKLGAQDVFWQEQGSYTGEVSIKNLDQLNVETIILGHSERRTIMNESSKMINRKLKLALKYNLNPIVCVGENEEIRNKGKEKSFLKKQLKETLGNLKPGKAQEIIIAYEPIWAIGTGKNMPAKEVKEMLSFIKEEVAKLYNKSLVNKRFVFIYGGSVNTENIKEISKYPQIQGVLVGGASLELNSFVKICKSILE
ncbi:MAG TPA: triose-phosphate isomerase [Patescibacteria group bacterium]|nr:triose-phosphate isomerase [Patescibacteria group bacterium]